MALPAESVFEMRTTGDNTNGGGFVAGASGTDYSQQDAKNTVGSDISTTDVVASGSSIITSATANFSTGIIGNIIYLQGGSGSLAASRYQVVSRSSATSIGLDRGVATGTGITMNIGGAAISLGNLGSNAATGLESGNKIFIKAGTYSVTVGSPNVNNGCFNTTQIIHFEGYQTTRGDLGTPPVLQASGISSFHMISLFNACIIKNIKMDGASLSGSKGFNTNSQNAIVYKCTAVNFTDNGFNGGALASKFYHCVATGCSSEPAFNGGRLYGCVAHANTITGFTSVSAERCISYGNTGANSDGFTNTSAGDKLINCVSYANGRDGFRSSGVNTLLINCIAESNTGVGFNFSLSNPSGVQLFNCAGFSAGTNVSLGTGFFVSNAGFVTGSGSFFTNAASGDFSLNATAGRGLALRAAGLPGIFPVGLTTGYLDIGAAQHQDAGGGGGSSSEHSAVF